MAKIIKLTQGCYTHVDDDVFEWASSFKWYAYKDGHILYARRHLGNNKYARLHREIMKAGIEEKVDHVDCNGLNNLRKNLRTCTIPENSRNSGIRRQNSTGFKGVCHFRKKYKAQIRFNNARYHLGLFTDPREAGMAYDRAAMLLHGEFARLNFPGAHHP